MRLLAIETSGEACSAALLFESEIGQRLSREPRRHGALILGMVESLLDEAGTRLNQLDAIGFGRGPGSFTGVRIAAAVAQGLGFGADLPLVPVSTLQGIAQGHHRGASVDRSLVAVDARMGEVYWGCCVLDGNGLMRLTAHERVCMPDLVEIPPGGGWQGAGSGWSAYGDLLRKRLEGRLLSCAPEVICEARDIALLAAADFRAGRSVPPEQAVPVYLRDRVAAVVRPSNG